MLLVIASLLYKNGLWKLLIATLTFFVYVNLILW